MGVVPCLDHRINCVCSLHTTVFVDCLVSICRMERLRCISLHGTGTTSWWSSFSLGIRCSVVRRTARVRWYAASTDCG